MNSGTAPLHVACMIAGFGRATRSSSRRSRSSASAWGVELRRRNAGVRGHRGGDLQPRPGEPSRRRSRRGRRASSSSTCSACRPGWTRSWPSRAGTAFSSSRTAPRPWARARRHAGGAVRRRGTFSFYPTKNLGRLRRGRRVRVAQAGGRSEGPADPRARLRPRYHHDIVGGNFRMDGFQGAVLNVKLPHLGRGPSGAGRSPGRTLRGSGSGARNSRPCPPYGRVGLPPVHDHFIRARRAARAPGRARGGHRPHLSRAAAPAEMLRGPGSGAGSFPVSERVAKTCISLPIFPELTDEQVGFVIGAVNSFR
jgi:hypothetical protein